MYLKALEIQGFKSFPEKTRLSFEKDITVIVGPNGSGKSNISDALLWVMGEQKSRMLRGGKMEDVIFGGTEKRGAMGVAQVTLVLDNTSRILQYDADEVSISRKYYRSGESEYYINREQVRLKDISELLMDTGLGCDGYSIIGQGRISEIVSAKSTDRREIFEEAAGISRFRHRKEESERKLEKTEDNLLRIGDKISELQLQLDPLKEQSEKAQKYLVLRDQLRVHEVSLWMSNLDNLHDHLTILSQEYDEADRCCSAASSEQDRLYAESERYSSKMHETEAEEENARSELSRVDAAIADTEKEITALNTSLEHDKESIVRYESELKNQKQRTDSLDVQISAHKERILTIHNEQEKLDFGIDSITEKLETNQINLEKKNRRLAEVVARENDLKLKIAENSSSCALLEESKASALDRQNTIKTDIAAAEQKLDEAEAQLRKYRAELTAATENADSLENVISGHNMLMEGREREASELAEKKTRLTVEARAAESRAAMLEDLEKEMEGYSKAAKIVVSDASKGLLRGVHGTVASLIRTKDRCSLAVETALGGHVGDIIVDSQDDSRAIFEMLKRKNAGRVTLQPIREIKSARLNTNLSGEDGFLGICSDLVETDDRYRAIINNLLGRTAVTETLSDAIRIARKYGNSFRIVTLDGQQMNTGGSMTGGSAGKSAGILSRANELDRLKQQLRSVNNELRNVTEKEQEARRILEASRFELNAAKDDYASAARECTRLEGVCSQLRLLKNTAEDALQDLEDEQVSFSHRIKEYNERIAKHHSDIASAEHDLSEIRITLNQASGDIDEFMKLREELESALSDIRAKKSSLSAEKNALEMTVSQLNELQQEIENGGRELSALIEATREKDRLAEAELTDLHKKCSELTENAAAVRERIAAIIQTRMEYDRKRTSADKAAQEKNRELLDAERNRALIDQKKQAAEMEERQVVDKLWESYELSRSEAQKVRQPVDNISHETKTVSDLRRSISALGNPNIGAIDEYKRVSERYGFLSSQRDDVERSKNEILQIIRDITTQMEQIFVQKIQEIDSAFRQIFVELFGGGKAALSLENMNDVLNCGIDIRIQPPGKAVSNISLLSGGEKAFVAIALYFAIISVRPTPFCVMDEIESALDEDNVSRYASYMKKMCSNTQFIAITHRRGTMDEADQLYGVTMQEKGVSTVITMDMNEALRIIR